jgi:hypothetical protein
MLCRGTSLIRNSPPTLGPPYAPKHEPTVGSYEGDVSYERGTPVVRDATVEKENAFPVSREGENFKGFEDVCLTRGTSQGQIMANLCRIRTTALPPRTAVVPYA